MTPIVSRTARTTDLAIGERHDGPILRRRDGQRLDRRRQNFDRHAASLSRSSPALDAGRYAGVHE